eukprot:13088659-Alexandrium_andersonii.AAC.1
MSLYQARKGCFALSARSACEIALAVFRPGPRWEMWRPGGAPATLDSRPGKGLLRAFGAVGLRARS